MMKRDDGGASGHCVLDVRLWGKRSGLSRPYPVMCHLLDTGAVFQALWDVVLGDELKAAVAEALDLGVVDARSVVSFWAGLHDLGKITPPFQSQVPGCYKPIGDDPAYVCAQGAEAEKGFRHEIASHWSLYPLLAETGYPGGERLLHRSVSHQVAQLLGGHHGLFGAVLNPKRVARAEDYNPGLGWQGWGSQRLVHFVELRRAMGAFAVPRGGLPSGLAVVVFGLVVVADWLAGWRVRLPLSNRGSRSGAGAGGLGVGVRFTSARAESTACRKSGHSGPSVHLRSRGKHLVGAPDRRGTYGSPPLARRARVDSTAASNVIRFTSARAESTQEHEHDQEHGAVHLRSRGKHDALHVEHERERGSPPLARRAPGRRCIPGDLRQFISARAGSTRTPGDPRLPATVHLCRRGEHVVSTALRRQTHLRTRGARPRRAGASQL
uniref:CRISPR-associated endonuclease Cas3'' n=1 Tax=unclassified Streptomyces TaxID=2593676 RepID=UPI003C7C1DEC